MPLKLNHPPEYYVMRDEIIALMEDQAGKPFDASNFRTQFRIVAGRHNVPATCYQSYFGIIQGMVRGKLPKMKPRQPMLL